ncbi:hypothetical protein ONS96_013308 [Cadophora gregata f. sp. sojae]|nr:hypothetical protein ONS96_013308 [Cadophora gregata f. sp. sojae]
MRKLISRSLLLAAFSTCVQGDRAFEHTKQRTGLSDLLAALDTSRSGGQGQGNGGAQIQASPQRNGAGQQQNEIADLLAILEGTQLGGVKSGNGGAQLQGSQGSQKGSGGNRGSMQGGQGAKTVTVTKGTAAAGNGSCPAEKTVTKTISVSGPAALETGFPANVTVITTVTAQVAPQSAAEAPTMPAGIMPPAGAVGTGEVASRTSRVSKPSEASTPGVASEAAVMPAGVMPPAGAAAGSGPLKTAGIVKTNDGASPPAASAVPGVNPPAGAAGTAPAGTGKTPAIIKTNDPAVGNMPIQGGASAPPAIASPPPVGAPGQMASGVGTLVPGGACDCSCLCAPGSFPNMEQMGQAPAAAPAVAPAIGTTMTTLTSAAIVKVTPGVQAPPQPQAESPSVPVAQPQVQPPPSPSPPSSASTSAPASSTGASSIELSVSGPFGQAAALVRPSSSTTPGGDAAANAAAAINISTFLLTSSLVLGSLASPTNPPKA